ncbi:pimeloyl-ACP methyl ester carboxylesterase [Phyllobacterium myrsinacearum]|nr:pimeloyl-ACP methyl ester carboxylesterase [Phyllobacterium myrsinacearum]RZS77223.1 pimeloyl-ACP methyl ester carboxylesterase [Phyllobacterium myrsinacearum]RZV06006.1 pimeloyl-ACP methyl ester carboxylesterase [Phyllobacterium myrsinacearum]
MMLQTLHRSKTPSGAAYIDQGQGRETLVLIHGVGMRIEAWGPQIARFSKDHRVIAVDLPGHGFSAPLDALPEMPHFVAWFARLIDELGLEAVNVAGHSMGALIAAGFAATEPSKLRRVALLNGVYKRTPMARQAVEARADQILSGAFDREAPLERWFSADEKDGEAYHLVHELLQQVDSSGYAAAYRAFATGDAVYLDSWPTVTAPAMFLTGDGDKNSTAEMAEEMAKAAPRGQAVVIKGHRHMVNLTAPQEVSKALADWLTWQTAQ